MITIGNEGIGNIDRPYDKEVMPNVSAGKGYGNILKGLQKIKDKYDASVAEKAREYGRSGITEKTFENDDEILSRATAETESKYSPKRVKKAALLNDTAEDVGREKASLGSQYEERLYKIRAQGNKNLMSHAEKMSRSGLSNSSIAGLKKEAIENDVDHTIMIEDQKYAGRINALNDKIRRARSSYEDAMRDYEISYAIELEKKVDKYTKERDRLIASYESSVDKESAKKEKEYLKEYEELNAAFEAENGDYAGDKKDNYRERYDYVLGEMANMTNKQKQNFVSIYGESLEGYLGLYYQNLLSSIGG